VKNNRNRPAPPHRSYCPISAVKTQETVIIGKIDHPVLILNDPPVLGAGIIGIFGIIDDVRDTDRILAKTGKEFSQ
jgi:hypothetical protein